MRIAYLRAISMHAPTSEPARLSFAAMPERHMFLIEVEDAAGHRGYGECWANHPPWACEERMMIFRHAVLPLLTGREVSGPTDATRLIAASLMPVARQAGALGPAIAVLSGVEIALWDLLGKRLGVPVAVLLGGRTRVAVPAYASSVQAGDDELLEALAARNVGAVKCRVGFGREADVRVLETAREALGEHVTLLADANRAWSLREAIPAVRNLGMHGVDWIEEPLRRDDPEQLSRLVHSTGVPVAMGENRYGLEGFTSLAKTDAVAVWQPDVSKVGGIATMAAICDLAVPSDRTVTPHWYGGPLALAATLQVAAARPSIDRIEYDVRDNPLVGVVSTPLPMTCGRVDIPDGPGLGVELDLDAVHEFEEKT